MVKNKAMETIFFATFESGHGNMMDRREYYDSEKTLSDFHQWIEKIRTELEDAYRTPFVVINIQFIKS